MASRVYRYKLDPNRRQRMALERTLDLCRDVFNLALEQRKLHPVGRFEQMRQLTQLKKAFPQYNAVHVHVLQNVLKRLHRAFENMWKRGCGFPRFKSADRYNSFDFNNVGFSMNGRRLSLSKIGNVKLRLSREIPAGSTIKKLAVKRTVNGWFACFVLETFDLPLPSCELAVGLDVGIENFAALSDGEFVSNPRFYENSQVLLRKAQRRVARRQKGSKNRKVAVARLAKIHDHIRASRMDRLHKVSTALVNRYGLIAIEKLNIAGLCAGIIPKQIHDAGWGTFISLLKYKASSAGRRVVEVSARFTSQECPACGTIKKKALSERRHVCGCGYSAHRDTAAAQVILARAVPSGDNLAEVIA